MGLNRALGREGGSAVDGTNEGPAPSQPVGLPDEDFSLMTAAPVYQSVLKRLAALAMALGTTTTGAAQELSEIPLHVMRTLMEADELWNLTDRDRLRLVSLLARDARPSLRVGVAEHLASHPAPVLDEDTEALLEWLACDPDPRVRRALATTMKGLVPHLTGLERTSLVGRWATSARVEQRLIVAQVLQQRFPVLWEDAIVDHLTRDPSQEVRAAARGAAEARGLRLS